MPRGRPDDGAQDRRWEPKWLRLRIFTCATRGNAGWGCPPGTAELSSRLPLVRLFRRGLGKPLCDYDRKVSPITEAGLRKLEEVGVVTRVRYSEHPPAMGTS